MRIAIATVLAAAAYAVLVAHHLRGLCAHLVTARPVEEIAWRQEARGREKREGGEGGGDAATAGDIQLGSCTARKMKYASVCVQSGHQRRSDVLADGKNNSADVQRSPRGDLPPTSYWCCGSKPRRGPRAKKKIFLAANRHKRVVHDFACRVKSRRGPPAALPGTGVWRYERYDDGIAPALPTTQPATIFPKAVPDMAQLFQRGG